MCVFNTEPMRLIISICSQYKRSKCGGSGSVGQPTDPSDTLCRSRLIWRIGPTEAHSTPQKENNVQRASLAGVRNRSNIFTLHFASLARDTRSLGSVSLPPVPPGTIFSANVSLFLLLLQDPLYFLHCGWLAEEKALDLARCTLSGKVEHFSAFFFSRQQTSGVQRLSERERKKNLPRLLFATCVRK